MVALRNGKKKAKQSLTDLPDFPTGSYVARKDSRRVADKSDVTAAIPSDTCCILNALGRDQFSGENASYGRPGRIKGSEHLPWSELLNDAGCFHDAKTPQSCFDATGALSAGRVITYCGGAMRIVACIEDPAVIKAILAHLAGKAHPVHAPRLPPGRAPPAPG
jgi:3-mercaptopyruvate sulfurtransferase SseA